MKSRRLRLFLFLALTSAAVLLVLQGYWFKKAFEIGDKQFEKNVSLALRNVAYILLRFNANQSEPIDMVCRYTDNYYIVRINDQIDPYLLEISIRQELKKQQINSDFEYTIYDCGGRRFIHSGKWNAQTAQTEKGRPLEEFPTYHSGFGYFGVFFPEKNFGILREMEIWIYSSSALLVVLGFFAYSLLTLFKQKRLSEIQNDFINTMTHELRTPVASLNLAAQVLAKRHEEMEENRRKRYMEVVVKESNRLQEYVERFLQIAKTESDAVVLRPQNIQLNEFLREIKDDFNIRNHHSLERIRLELPQKQFELITDTFHLRQMLFNLLDNAVKYGPVEEPIILRLRIEDHKLLIEVEDKGPGIPKNVQKLVFSRFFRATQGNRYEQQGFGLGLYYVAQMAKRLKAKAGYRHVSDHSGSVFYIQFSLA